MKVVEILRGRDWPEDYIRAVVSHGWGLCSDVEPLTDLEKTLYAIDELTGLVTASALVRPSKSILDMGPKSVVKKWKDKAFAAGANRASSRRAPPCWAWSSGALIQDTIEGMRPVAEAIGLKGTPAAVE